MRWNQIDYNSLSRLLGILHLNLLEFLSSILPFLIHFDVVCLQEAAINKVCMLLKFEQLFGALFFNRITQLVIRAACTILLDLIIDV